MEIFYPREHRPTHVTVMLVRIRDVQRNTTDILSVQIASVFYNSF
jgi:hypothetical protein